MADVNTSLAKQAQDSRSNEKGEGWRPTIHGTLVAIGGRGVLLQGASGSGKSDLALRLIDRGAQLVADDRVIPFLREGRLWGRVPPTIAGLIEVRGIGLVPCPYLSECPIHLLVQLDAPVERMPERLWRDMLDVRVPYMAVRAFEQSAPLKVEFGLNIFPTVGRAGE